MGILLWKSSHQKMNSSIAIKYVVPRLIVLFIFYSLVLERPYASEDTPDLAPQNDDGSASITNPFNSTCYDWKGNIIPCDFKRPYAEIMFDSPTPECRFTDNKDGTVTDNMTGLVWLKNMSCFGIQDWQRQYWQRKVLRRETVVRILILFFLMALLPVIGDYRQ